MNRAPEFRPKWISPPGETIADVLRDRNLPVQEFAKEMGVPVSQIEDLLRGRANITIGLARQLARVLGSSVEFWMARDYQYQEDAARLRMTGDEWLSDLPLSDMINFGWVKPERETKEGKLNACLDFFDVPNVAAWHKRYAVVEHLAAFRTSRTFRSEAGALAAWLRKGEIEANASDCARWSLSNFESSLTQIRRLTRSKDPQKFVPKLREICAASGVALVVARAPKGCRASGATKFVSDNRALLMLSFRYLSDDQFWFTFFHEAGHLVLHGRNETFIEGVDQGLSRHESEANDFAGRTLIPSQYAKELLRLSGNAREVIRFSMRVGIAPGIVVGQLQHHQKIRHNQLYRLKRHFTWAD